MTERCSKEAPVEPQLHSASPNTSPKLPGEQESRAAHTLCSIKKESFSKVVPKGWGEGRWMRKEPEDNSE